jgi:large subunit ribosomal protein L23
MQQILIKPLITEKMTADTEKNNSFGFVVADGANKVEIKKAIEKEYGVNVTSVRHFVLTARADSDLPKLVSSKDVQLVTRRPS